MISVEVDGQELEKAQAMLKNIPGAMERALRHTKSRVIEGMRTDAVSSTREKYYAKSGDIRKSIRVTSTGIISRGKRLMLQNYYLSPKSPVKKSHGLKGAVKKDGIKSLPGAFILRLGAAGRAWPYIRVGKGRWGIKALHSPSIPQIVKNEQTLEYMESGVQRRFEDRMRHEVMREMKLIT